jgi:hypothetical protein
MWRDVRMFFSGVVAGLAVALALTAPAGELRNVKPYPEGRVWVPGNVIVSMRTDEFDEIEMQCVPIAQHDRTKRNPENFH